MLLLCLAMILAVSAVSAADDDDSPLQAVDDGAVASTDADVLGDGEKTFTDLRADIENGGSEIKLEYDYKYNETVDIVDDWHDEYGWYGKNNTDRYTEGVLIAKDCTIDGQGHYIDGANVARIFKVDTFRDVTLKNIEFRNGNATVGSAIYSSGKLTLENCIFINNTDDSVYILEEQPEVYVINNESSYNAQLADPTSPLNSYYYNWPREDGIDINGNPVHTPTPKIVGHSWQSAITAPTYPSETSSYPWITLKMNNFTGNIVFKYDGEVKFTWTVFERNYAIISVPNDLKMTDYRLKWGTGEPLDKVFDPSKLEVIFKKANPDPDNVSVIYNKETYDAQLNTPNSALNKYYVVNPREDGIDIHGNPVHDDTTEIVGHSWESAISAPTDPPATSKLPWVTVNMNNFTGTIVCVYDGAIKFTWHVVNKEYGIISVPAPGDMNMPDYGLIWNTSTYKDKVFESSKLNVLFVPDDMEGTTITPEDLFQAGSLAASDSTFYNATGTVNAEGTVYRSDAKISGNLDIGVNTIKNLNILLNGNKYGTATLDAANNFDSSVPNVPAGTYTISFGDDNGNSFVLEEGVANELVVSKYTPTITVASSDVYYPEAVIVNVTSDVTGSCSVSVGSKSQFVYIVEGVTQSRFFRRFRC